MGVERDLLLDGYLGSQKLREILTLLYYITLSSSRENQRSAQEVAGHPQVQLWPIGCLLVHKKSSKSFAVFGLRLILISCDVKNKQKTATDNGHYVNRLVPKNGIK